MRLGMDMLLWIINAPHTHTDTLTSQVLQNTAYHLCYYISHFEFAKSSTACVHNCQTGSEATNHDVSSQIHACMCICNWVSVSEPHLIVLMCKPFAIHTRAVSLAILC